MIILANRFRNSSHTTIAIHNKSVGQRKGVCDRTKNANKNGDAKRSKNSGDQIFSRPGAQQKCGNSKQQCAAEVKETKVVRDNERDAKYGRRDNNTDQNATSRIFQLVRCAGIESIRFPFRFDASQPPFGFRHERLLRVSSSQKRVVVYAIGSRCNRNRVRDLFGVFAQASAGEFDSILHWLETLDLTAAGGRARFAVCRRSRMFSIWRR